MAYRGAADGSPRQRAVHGTGGKGGMPGGSVVDHLASQGSLTYDRGHHLLFAVSAGSDTRTGFAVHGERLERRRVISCGGSFPVGVAARDNPVFVLNARAGGSLRRCRLAGGELPRAPRRHRELRLNTDEAPEFSHTPARITFTPEGERPIVTTREGGASVEVLGRTGAGRLTARPVVNGRPGYGPFGRAHDRGGRPVVADTALNTVPTFRLRADGRAALVDEIATGRQATCWIVRFGNRFDVSSAGSDTVSGLRQSADGRLRPLAMTATGTGPVDSAVPPDGRFLYVQTGGEGSVDVFRVRGDGSLRKAETRPVPDAVGGEGIVDLGAPPRRWARAAPGAGPHRGPWPGPPAPPAPKGPLSAVS